MFSNSNLKNFINNSVSIYIYISTILYLLFIISPITSLMLNTPLYSFQKYLGLLGGLLLFLDLLVNKEMLRNRYNYLLYLIVFIAIVSSLLKLDYGIKDNLFIIVWTTIFITLFYSYSSRVGKDVFIKNINILYNTIISIWILACIVSILSYLFSTGYFIKDNPYTFELTRQGFIDNRLFGVFSSVNAASLVSGLLLMIGIYKYIKYKYKYLIFTNVILFIYIILSGSRNVQVALYVSLFLSTFAYIYIIIKEKKLNTRILKSLIISFATVILLYGTFTVTKNVLSVIPKATFLKDNKYTYNKIISYYPNTKVSLNNDKINLDDDILNRPDVDPENVSNNRVKIWKDYLSLYREIGFIGLSPANYIDYIYNNHKDLYIVKFVIDNDGGENVDIYKTHNGYLLTYVSTGIIGLLSFIIFILLVLKKIIMSVFYKDDRIINVLPVFMIVVYFLVAILFDRSYLFYNDILSCIFWLVIGYLGMSLKEI